jgi:hypothetical protein
MMKEAIITIAVILSILAGICLLIFGLGQLKGWQCIKRGEIVGYEAKWTGITGAWCVLKIDNKWIPYDSWINNKPI